MDFIDKTANNGNNNDTSKNKNNESIKTKNKHLMLGTAIFIAAILVVSGSIMRAFADNVNLVQVTLLAANGSPLPSGTALKFGESVVARYQVVGTSGSGDQSGCNTSDGTKLTMTLSASSGLTPSTASLTFDGCGPTFAKTVQFTSNYQGSTQIGASVTESSFSDSGGGSYSFNTNFGVQLAAFTPTTTAPVINPSSVPSNQVAEATSSSGAIVSFSTPTATGSPTPTVSCSPASGSTFPLGTTPVTCTAINSAGSASASFSVSVVDTTEPTLNLPPNQIAEATGPTGAAVDFSATASDIVDGARPVTCSPPSGAIFPLGTTTVNCEASDTSGHTAKGSFTVMVLDRTPPTLNLPSNPQTAEATGPTGAAVDFSATGTDTVDTSVDVVCDPASGATFPLGITPVTCTATDDFGNAAKGSFDVKVVDTTPPVIASHADLLPVGASSASGATVTYTNPTATDIVDTSVDVVCKLASGSTFPIGITTVTCDATDDSGNKAKQTSFKVTVNIPSIQFPLPPINPDGSSVFKGGSTVPFKLVAQYSTGAQASDLVINLFIVKTSSNAPTTPVNEAVSTSAATSGTLFRWDSTALQHIYNLSTKGLDQTAIYKAYATVNGFSITKDITFGLK